MSVSEAQGRAGGQDGVGGKDRRSGGGCGGDFISEVTIFGLKMCLPLKLYMLSCSHNVLIFVGMDATVQLDHIQCAWVRGSVICLLGVWLR